MASAVVALLAILAQIAPSLGSTAITSVINALVQIVPALISTIEDVVPMIKNIIAALKANALISPQQLADLAVLDAATDAAFEAAATAAQAEDNPPAPGA